jgi:hypothetical protein
MKEISECMTKITECTVPGRCGVGCSAKRRGGRGRTERLMRRLGVAGVVRGKTVRTTIQDKDGVRLRSW